MDAIKNKKSLLLTLASLVAIGVSVIGIGNMGNAKAATTTPCIITVFGKQYDVTAFQNSHSGGNVFNCGADMTSTYQSAHGTNVSRLQPYLIVAATPTPTVTPSPTTVPSPTVTPEPTISPSPTVTPSPTTVPEPTVSPVPGTNNNHVDDDDDEEEEIDDDNDDNDDHDNDEEEVRRVDRKHTSRDEDEYRESKSGERISRLFRGGDRD